MAGKALESLVEEDGLTLTRRRDIVFIQEGRELKPHIIYICTIENPKNGESLQITTTEMWVSLADILRELLRAHDEFEYPDWITEFEETEGYEAAEQARSVVLAREKDLENLLDPKFDRYLAVVCD